MTLLIAATLTWYVCSGQRFISTVPVALDCAPSVVMSMRVS